ncbi:hypothetical protein DPMN_121862 [Dreissena polymorpha]|uniref:Uncharacterized protein n=1 Tax=Dreissena polymorpha TaxID=45954 RepID=A0A9D4GNJ5_DREPO|nr:hypothetical protein DPMN_121862 [Dreissena polymorpha]
MTDRQTGQKQYTPIIRSWGIKINNVKPHHDPEDMHEHPIISSNRYMELLKRFLTRAFYQQLQRHGVNSPPPGGHDFQQTRTIFNLIQDIIKTNVLTKFHEDLTINVSFRVKNALSSGGHVFQPIKTIFGLVQDIIGINLLTKFHEDRKINVVSRVLTMLTPPNG